MEFKAICLFNISTLGVCAHMGMCQDLVHPKRHGLLLKVTSIWQSVGSVNLNFVIFCPPILRLRAESPSGPGPHGWVVRRRSEGSTGLRKTNHQTIPYFEIHSTYLVDTPGNLVCKVPLIRVKWSSAHGQLSLAMFELRLLVHLWFGSPAGL